MTVCQGPRPLEPIGSGKSALIFFYIALQPLNGILEAIEAMRNEMTATTSSDFIDTSEIAELLALTISTEVSTTSNPIAPFQLSDALSAVVVSLIANPELKKGISVNFIINDPELRSATLLGDKLRIQQLLANFCWNSLKGFTSDDGGRFEISVDFGPCAAEKPGFKRFCFKVADTGIGRIDEPGLDICRKLAGLMGGEVRCASVAGKGSTFSLELDMEIDANSPSSMSEPATPLTSGKFRLVPEQPHRGTSSPCSSEADAESFYLRTPSSVSLETDRAAATNNAAAPAADDADDANAGHSGSPSNREPSLQRHFEKYMMANPWASGAQQVYQPPYPTGFNQQAPLNLMAATFKVLRETVYDDSAAVLIEMHTPEKVWRQWGSATMVNGDIAAALRAAADDATRRITVFFQSQDSRARMPARQAGRSQNAPSTPHFPEPPSASADVKPSGWPVASPGASLMRSRSFPAAQHPVKPKDHERSLTKIQPAKTSGVSSADPTTLPSLTKILVVDGDLQHLREMQEALKCSSSTSSKFEVTIAEDGQDVIRLCVAKGIRYDVILLAEKMKHLNGSDTAYVYRKYEALNCLSNTLMILTASDPSQLDVTFYQTCGIDGVIEKPTLTKDLAKDVMTCFEWRLKNGMHRPVGRLLCSRTGKLLAEATEAKSSVWMKDTESFESSLFVGDSNEP